MLKEPNELTKPQLEDFKKQLEILVKKQARKILRKQKRFDTRIEREFLDKTSKEQLEENLQDAIALRDDIQNNGGNSSSLATANKIVANSQAAVDGHEDDPAFYSELEAQLIQLEIDEINLVRQARIGKIAENDALIAS